MVRDLALEKEWKIRFEEHKKSGLSIKAWCAKNGFKATTFHYWIKRFKASEQNTPPMKSEFAEVVLESYSNNNSAENIKLCLTYGRYTIGISAGFNPATLAELLKVLQRL